MKPMPNVEKIASSWGGNAFRIVAWILSLAAVALLAVGIMAAMATGGGSIEMGYAFMLIGGWSLPCVVLSIACVGVAAVADNTNATARHAIIHTHLLRELIAAQQIEPISFTNRGMPVLPQTAAGSQSSSALSPSSHGSG